MFIALKDKIKRAVYKIIPPPLVNVSYSQAGEDAVLSFLFQQLKITKPTYLELGVCKPDIGSNTFKFYKNGATGVLVEADVTLIPSIKKMRPNDTIIHAGVSADLSSESEFYIFDEKGYNTFSKEEAMYRENHSNAKIIRTVRVNMLSINNILEKYFRTTPDFLSIDIEGLDFLVLNSLNFEKFPIPVICAETCSFSENHLKEKNKEIIELMISKGYMVYADTYINTIFVHENWFKNIMP